MFVKILIKRDKNMKKIILLLSVVFCSISVNAQVDIITKHSGEVVKGKVIRIEDYSVVFKYDGEDAENSIGKYAIEKIVYGKSGRVEEVTEKITISSEADWEKVIILKKNHIFLD